MTTDFFRQFNQLTNKIFLLPIDKKTELNGLEQINIYVKNYI